jgi:hypothetical protein
MSALSPILHKYGSGRLAFWCPGCGDAHALNCDDARGGPVWGYNGTAEAPTFTPSVLVTYNGPDAGQLYEDGHRAPPSVCHSFITDGAIQFLGDCTHALAGQTVPLPPFPIIPSLDDKA